MLQQVPFEALKSISIVATDLDGTMLTSEHDVPQQNLKGVVHSDVLHSKSMLHSKSCEMATLFYRRKSVALYRSLFPKGIREAKSKGVQVLVASGRSRVSAQRLFEGTLDLYNQAGIYLNGTRFLCYFPVFREYDFMPRASVISLFSKLGKFLKEGQGLITIPFISSKKRKVIRKKIERVIKYD